MKPLIFSEEDFRLRLVDGHEEYDVCEDRRMLHVEFSGEKSFWKIEKVVVLEQSFTVMLSRVKREEEKGRDG